jgi:hydroxymethylpyrimidine pyrophosphatase-like HAD family hydrolase
MYSPLIIFLDLDGTIIGPIDNQIAEWEIVNQLNKSIKKFGIHHKQIPYNVKSLRTNLKKNIIRPGFKKFLNSFSKKDVQFFIYTASTYDWATFIVKNIEEALGIKMNRPIFARNSCIEESPQMYIKSLKKVMPKAKKSLSSIYSEEELDNARCILIDNNNTLIYDEVDLLYRCSTYNGMAPYSDLLWIESYIMNKQVENMFMRILSVFLKCKECRYDIRSKLYMRLCDLSNQSANICQSKSNKDTMWKHMYKIIMNKGINEIGRIV